MEEREQYEPDNPIRALERSIHIYKTISTSKLEEQDWPGQDKHKEQLMEDEVYLGTPAGREEIAAYVSWLRQKARDALYEKESIEFLTATEKQSFEYHKWLNATESKGMGNGKKRKRNGKKRCGGMDHETKKNAVANKKAAVAAKAKAAKRNVGTA